MTFIKTVCDRCGNMIEEKKPDRISVERWTETPNYTSVAHVYKPIRKIELCEECAEKFYKFLDGGEIE